MLRPPTHRADAPIVYVHPSDDAWDQDRIKADLADKTDHPLQQYWGGYTRYDLTPAVQAYFKPDARPTKFYLRRLKWDEWMRCKGMWERSVVSGDPRPVEAFVEACRLGLVRIDNGPEIDPAGGRLSDRDMQRIQDLSTDRYEMILDVGQAAYQASMPLSEAEKKA